MWRASRTGRPGRVRQARATRCTLGLEGLEQRCLLSAGGLDLTFGPFGYRPTARDGQNLNASSIAIQADQKIIIGGAISNTGGATPADIALERLNPDGSLDQTFGAGGMVPASFTGQGLPSGTYDPGLAIALQGDGKIVVAGSLSNSTGTQFFVERFNANGSVDTAFATGGSEVINFGSGTSEAHAVAITANGEILVAGVQTASGRSGFALALLQANGTLDTTFGPNGTGLEVTYFSLGSQGSGPPPPGPTINASATAVLIQGDGSFYVAGMATTLGPPPPSGPRPVDTGFALARYSANGNLDGTFGTGGEVSTDFQGMDTATSLAVQSNGMILLGGSAGGAHFGLVRYLTTGIRDLTFGSGGIATATLPGQSRINGIALQSDGKIVAAGFAGATSINGSLNGQTTSFALARYNSDGSPDGTFGKSGVATTSIGAQADGSVGIALDKNGKIVVAGNTADSSGKSAFVAARYLVQNDAGDLNQRFLAQLYRDLLHRDVDPTGLAGFSSVLDSGKASRLDVARAIEASREFKTVLVTDIYRELLGRAPDQQGLQGWVTFLLNGGRETQVEALIAGSAEFFQKSGGNNTTFLDALYHVALGRPVDASGAQSFGNALSAGTPRSTVAELVFTSLEGEQDLVESFYVRSLHRQADTGGLNGFAGALQRGTRQDEVRALIVSSDEYLQNL